MIVAFTGHTHLLLEEPLRIAHFAVPVLVKLPDVLKCRNCVSSLNRKQHVCLHGGGSLIKTEHEANYQTNLVF